MGGAVSIEEATAENKEKLVGDLKGKATDILTRFVSRLMGGGISERVLGGKRGGILGGDFLRVGIYIEFRPYSHSKRNPRSATTSNKEM